MRKYLRKIVGVAKRVSETFVLTHTSSTKFAEKVRYRSEFQIHYGFRLECGHVVEGSRGKGKKSMICYECEMEADTDPYVPAHRINWLEYDRIYTHGEWIDASEHEAERIRAQS